MAAGENERQLFISGEIHLDRLEVTATDLTPDENLTHAAPVVVLKSLCLQAILKAANMKLCECSIQDFTRRLAAEKAERTQILEWFRQHKFQSGFHTNECRKCTLKRRLRERIWQRGQALFLDEDPIIIRIFAGTEQTFPCPERGDAIV